MKQLNIITNTLILTATSFLIRIIGMLSTIFLSSVLGTSGLGIYELLMSIYMTAVVFASAGLCSTVSRLVAEEIGKNNPQNITLIMRITLMFGFATSMFVSAGLVILAPKLVLKFIHDPSATLGLRFLALSIPFMTCSSSLRGYFYASSKAFLPASADIIEQTVKISLILLLVTIYAPYGNTYAYAAMGVALTIGEIVSWTYVTSMYILDRKKNKVRNVAYTKTKSSVFKELLHILLPLAGIAYITYIFSSIENIIIPEGLHKFNTSFMESMSTLGILKGMVLPILVFPSALLTAFSTTLIPEISKAVSNNNYGKVNRTASKVLQLTFMLSIFVVAIFFTYGDELGMLIYKTEKVGPLLKVLTIIVPFMYIEVISDGLLKGLDKQASCLKFSIFDSIGRIILIYFLVPIKGVKALVLVMIVSGIFTSVLNFSKLLESTSLKINIIDWFLKPGIVTIFAATYSKIIITKLLVPASSLAFTIILGVGLCLLISIPLLFALQCLKVEDINWIKVHIKSA